ncbi:P-loop containing nucleoside triphosphate hydrolase protein [Phlebopus sp. FC_14]|nr:P-loop containing nucleoside triphosphate hydrolase protein [Phlebopus sp. FC_14]
MREGLSYLHLSKARPGALRWTAAEFFSATPIPTTKKSDVYSLGSLILYVLSGEQPWAKMRDSQVIYELCQRHNPPRPQSPVISQQRWSFIQDCWSPGSPDRRPTATKVLSFIRSELNTQGPKKIVLFGESGVGKSSLINLIAGEDIATVSDSAATCTSRTEMHNITVDSCDLVVFDTVGLSAATYLDALEEAYTLLRLLQSDGDVDLIVLCVRASLSWHSLEHQYRLCHEFLGQEQIPVAMVVTGLEYEHRMEKWWDDHSDWMDGHGIKVTAHACITATPGYRNALAAQYEESKRSVRALLRTCIRGCNRTRTRNILGWFGAPKSTRGQMVQLLTSRCGLDEEEAERLVRRIQRNGVSERR